MKTYFTEDASFEELTRNLLICGWALLEKRAEDRIYKFGRFARLGPYGIAIETVEIKKPEKPGGYVFDPVYTIRIQGCDDWARLLYAKPTNWEEKENSGVYVPVDEAWEGDLPEMPGLDIDRDYSNTPRAAERELLALGIDGIPSTPEGRSVIFVPNGKPGEIFREEEIKELLTDENESL